MARKMLMKASSETARSGRSFLKEDSLSRTWWKGKRGPAKGGRLAFGAVLRPFKAAVSTQNTRFMEDGFDLDLAYVTKRIIVHGVPNKSADPLYEDPRTEVRRLLDKYHFNRYKVYNFASELAQMTPNDSDQAIDGRVERYPFTDDTCPPLESVVDFCENAKVWLDSHEENVVSLHCKAGKGRAGIMAACLMVRMGQTAQEAVASYDATQVTDAKGRPEVNQRAWVFLYERLIREVWGLRDTIGAVSGQFPNLKAVPRLATSLRDVCLHLEIPARRSRWRPILHHPSCAVYQQTPGGKTLVHRAKMPAVYTKAKGEAAAIFAAALPRSVVVEGTFQVVVSAATGLFGGGKNVLDVWCNTTFLGEDGGQETFTFTENDLPPGPLAERLLAARVCVVLTHTHPDAPSPVRRHTLTNWDVGDALGTRHEASSGSNSSSSNMMRPVQHSDTPETDPGASSDDVGEDEERRDASNSALTVRAGSVQHAPAFGRPASLVTPGENDDIRQYYLSSNQESTDSSSDLEQDYLQIAVVEDNAHARNLSGAPPWDVRLASQGSQRKMNGQSSGYSTPLPGISHPSPLRSCPRAAVSSRKEGLNERTDRIEESTQHKVTSPAAALSLPRWSAAKLWNPSTSTAVAQTGALPNARGTPARPGPSTSSVGLFKRLEGRARSVTTTQGQVEPNNALAVSEGSEVAVGDGKRRTDALGEDREEGGRMKPWVLAGLPQPGQTSRRPIRLDKLTLEEGFGEDRACLVMEGGEGREEDSDVKEQNVTARMTPVNDIDVGKCSPGVRRLLEAAARRSFEDPQNSPRTSLFGDSETDGRSDGECGRSFSGSFSDGDGERASRAAHVLAGWVGIGMRPPMTAFTPVPSLVERADYSAIPAMVERRLVPVESSVGSMGSGKFVETEDLTSIPPLKLRGWPPPKPVVAGQTEVQDVLMPPADGMPAFAEPCDNIIISPVVKGKGLHRRRKAGSTGSSWGEDAKRALAQKRLQWERTRRGGSEGNQSLRLHASLVAKREAELLAIETDVKQAVQLLEDRIARRESAEAALKKWRRQLPPKAYEDVMGCLQGNQSFGLYGSG